MLSQSGVDLSQWGKGEACTVEQFLDELGAEESVLRFYADGSIARVLRVVKLIITDPEKGTLLEDYQILPDGRRKDRQHTPGGKIGNHETPREAVVREMDEELNLKSFDYLFKMERPHIEEKPSRSHPTLRSIYEMHPAYITTYLHDDAKIEDGYNTIDKEDGKTRLFFRWSGKNQNPKS